MRRVEVTIHTYTITDCSSVGEVRRGKIVVCWNCRSRRRGFMSVVMAAEMMILIWSGGVGLHFHVGWERKSQPVADICAAPVLNVVHGFHPSWISSQFAHTTHTKYTKLVFCFSWSSRQVNHWGENRLIISCFFLSLSWLKKLESSFCSLAAETLMRNKKEEGNWWSSLPHKNSTSTKNPTSLSLTQICTHTLGGPFIQNKKNEFQQANICWEMGSIPWGSVYTLFFINIISFFPSKLGLFILLNPT